MPISATQFITRTYQAPYKAAKLPDAAKKGETARKDSPETYNDFIWALAKKFTNSPEEAEAAVQEMVTDIEQCADKGVLARTSGDRLIARIAWRRLLQFLQ